MLASIAIGALLQAGSEPPTPNDFMSVFTATCLQNYFNPERLIGLLNQGGTELSGTDAQPFLRGSPGRSWRLEYRGRNYAVALRGDGICAVFAQEAAPEVAHEGFGKLLSSPAPPFEARKSPIGPGTGPLRTVSYVWARPDEQTQLQFTLTTSSEPTATIRAMASMVQTTGTK